MKYLLLTITASSILFFSCKKHESCHEYHPTCEVIDLSDTLDPVCGCDGVTYKNAGYAKCVGQVKSYTKGPCK